jgi:hypothetical protein
MTKKEWHLKLDLAIARQLVEENTTWKAIADKFGVEYITLYMRRRRKGDDYFKKLYVENN